MKNLHCLGTGMGMGMTEAEQIPLIAESGFEAFFTGWSTKSNLKAIKKLGDSCGLIYQSVHAPFTQVHHLWEEGTRGEEVCDELIRCIHETAEVNVPIVIIHPIIGMDRHNPYLIGLERYADIVRAAEDSGIKVAFENVEGIEYLISLRDALASSDAVGFCWDTGHEMCYNSSMDVPALFNGKLICTHINDNMRQTDPAKLTWLDDSHLLPFDGRADWQGIADRLDRENFRGIMTYEVTTKSKPERNTHAIYSNLSPLEFMKLAYEKALKLDSMRKL